MLLVSSSPLVEPPSVEIRMGILVAEHVGERLSQSDIRDVDNELEQRVVIECAEEQSSVVEPFRG